MQTAQVGDRVQVHYVKRLQDGATASSHDRAPVEVTVGASHPRLPGLGLGLVGMAPGERTTVNVLGALASGPSEAACVKQLPRKRFPKHKTLQVGQWAPVVGRHGRRRVVRVVELRGDRVVVDIRRRETGQAMELEVQLVRIYAPESPPHAGKP